MVEVNGAGHGGGRPRERALNRVRKPGCGPLPLACWVLGHLMNYPVGGGRGRGGGDGPGSQGSPLTPSLLQVVPDRPSPSARTGLVCRGKWMQPWRAGSTSQAQLPAPP